MTPQPEQIYLIELCSGERRRWCYRGGDALGAHWWRDMESGQEFNEASLMYAWQIIQLETEAEAMTTPLAAGATISPPPPPTLGPEIYRLVAEQMADALILADAQGIIRVWNSAAATLFGFSSQEALGTSLDLIIPEHLRAAHWAAFHRAMAHGATLHGAKARLTRALHADGRRLYVSMSFAVIDDGAGKVLASVAIAREAEKPSAA